VPGEGVSVKVEHPNTAEQVRTTRRVLVVDDHAGFRRCVAGLLVAEGFEVVGEAEDGAAAMSLARELKPELVLLDIQLPDIDGFAVTDQLLELDPQLNVVLVSSRDRSAYGPLIERSGARGFVAKSDLSAETLEAVLR
jgi:DNA-binding NarL/FixJ family response regulator